MNDSIAPGERRPRAIPPVSSILTLSHERRAQLLHTYLHGVPYLQQVTGSYIVASQRIAEGKTPHNSERDEVQRAFSRHDTVGDQRIDRTYDLMRSFIDSPGHFFFPDVPALYLNDGRGDTLLYQRMMTNFDWLADMHPLTDFDIPLSDRPSALEVSVKRARGKLRALRFLPRFSTKGHYERLIHAMDAFGEAAKDIPFDKEYAPTRADMHRMTRGLMI